MKRGHDCEVFVNRLWESRAAKDRSLVIDDVLIHEFNEMKDVPAPLTDINLWPWLKGTLSGAWRAARFFQERHAVSRFDLVHVSNFDYSIYFLDPALPLVMRMSHCAALWADLGEYGLSFEQFVVQSLERRAMLECDHLYAPSEFMADYFNQELGINISVLHPPAHMEITPQEFDLDWTEAVSSTGPYFLFVGSLCRTKGCHVSSGSPLEVFPSLS